MLLTTDHRCTTHEYLVPTFDSREGIRQASRCAQRRCSRHCCRCTHCSPVRRPGIVPCDRATSASRFFPQWPVSRAAARGAAPLRAKIVTPLTDHRQVIATSWFTVDLFKADPFPILYNLAHVAEWDLYSSHDLLAHVSWVG